MEFSTMVTRVGELINQDVSDDTKTITNTMVKAWLNIAYAKCRNAVVSTNQNFYYRLTKTDLVAEQATYTLPTDCRKIMRVEIGYVASTDRELADRADRNAIPDPDAVYSSGRPIYTVIGNMIELFPTPSAAVTDGLWLWYLEDVADLSANDDEPSMPEGYDWILPIYAASMAKYQLGLKSEGDRYYELFTLELENMKDESTPRSQDSHDFVILKDIT